MIYIGLLAVGFGAVYILVSRSRGKYKSQAAAMAHQWGKGSAADDNMHSLDWSISEGYFSQIGC